MWVVTDIISECGGFVVYHYNDCSGQKVTYIAFNLLDLVRWRRERGYDVCFTGGVSDRFIKLFPDVPVRKDL